MSKVDKILSSINYFYKMSSIMDALKGTLSNDEDLDELEKDLLSDHIDAKSNDNKISIQNKNYQLPLRVGKMGVDGEDPWVISGFVNKSVNISPRHPQGHEGVDYGAPKNASVYPIAPGVVIQTSETPKGGLNLTIHHEDDNLYSYYAHLNKINVSKGDVVSFDTIIGLNGNTGSAKQTAPHVHLETKIDNKKIDPRNVIGKQIGSLSI
jgi:murein DD-endopeptidase MepM/ murein hydrolase activator NlpD